MSLGLATVGIGCLMLLTVVGVFLKLVLDNIGRGDACPYCSAPLAPSVRICPHCHKALGKRWW
jgi:predicted amidophosphoribosyltransferase